MCVIGFYSVLYKFVYNFLFLQAHFVRVGLCIMSMDYNGDTIIKYDFKCANTFHDLTLILVIIIKQIFLYIIVKIQFNNIISVLIL